MELLTLSIILKYYIVKMQTKGTIDQPRKKLVSVRQVKCNLCLEWVQTLPHVQSQLFACMKCLNEHQSGSIICDPAGQPYLLTLTPYSQVIQLKKQPRSQDNLRNGLTSLDQSGIKLVKSGISTAYHEKENPSQSSLSLLEMIKMQSQSLSNSYLKIPNDNKNRSQLIQRQPQHEIDPPMTHKISSLVGKLATDSKATRKNNYQFFHSSSDIKLFKQNNVRACEKDFINETDPQSIWFGLQDPQGDIDVNQLFLQLKRNKRLTIRSHRSNPASQRIQPSLRFVGQSLKQRIDSYLETRYQSTSLHRILARNIKEAYQQTNILSRCAQLVSFNISSTDLSCYLSLLDPETTGTLKLINVGLKDDHIPALLDWISSKKVERLVLSCNKLTDSALQLFLKKALPYLKELYLGRNRINKYRVKELAHELRSKFLVYL